MILFVADHGHLTQQHPGTARPPSRQGHPGQFKNSEQKTNNRKAQSIPQMIANNSHPCVNSVPKRNNFRTRNNTPQRQWNNTPTNNYSNTLSSIRSWESLPEDDASTTSGSYVVDLADVEEAENLPYAVTV